jgi:hypothetical protein
MKKGIEFPISTMPGETVGHVYAGPMEEETIHFLECLALGRRPLATAEHAHMVMRVYQAADLSAGEGRPVEIRSPADRPKTATRRQPIYPRSIPLITNRLQNPSYVMVEEVRTWLGWETAERSFTPERIRPAFRRSTVSCRGIA